jgi:hypothetical protein
MIMKKNTRPLLPAIIPGVASSFLLFLLLGVAASQNPPENGPSFEGTVVSSGRETLVVKSSDNNYQLFTFDRNTARPPSLARGSRVRVASNPPDEAGVRLATRITVLEAAASPSGSGPAPDLAPPPQEVRDLEREIERQVRRWRLGVRVGAGLDPELFAVGVHSQMGPIFSRNFYFRPNAEFGFGELTDMIGLNLEGAYRLPVSSRQGRWSTYVGAGPSLNFIHQGLERRDVDFGNFDYETGFNIFSGVQFRGGTFVEAKTTLWAHPVPTLRLIFGYTF